MKTILIFILVFSHLCFAKEQPVKLSMYKLLSNEKKFDDKYISIAGVLGETAVSDDLMNGDSYSLYVDLGSMKNDVWLNSVYLSIDRNSLDKDKLDKLIGKYVLIEGQFHIKRFKSSQSGFINNVSRVREYPLLKKLD